MIRLSTRPSARRHRLLQRWVTRARDRRQPVGVPVRCWPTPFRELPGPHRVRIGHRDVDGRPGCFGGRVDPGPRITNRVPQVPGPGGLLFVGGGGLEPGQRVLQRGHPVPGDLPGAGHLVPGSVLLQLRNELSGEPNDLAGRRCELGVPGAAASPRGEQEWDGDGDGDQGGDQQPPRPGGGLGRWRRGLRGHYRRGRRRRGGGDGHRFDRRRDRGGRRRRRFPDLPVCVTSAETQRIEDRNARAAPGPYRVRSKRHGFRTHRKPGMALDGGHCRSAGHFEPNERSRGWLVKFDRTAPII